MKRFCRLQQLLGRPALLHLRAARVAVFGLGAVGSYAVEALARAGVGRLQLIDGDRIRASNFNRQLYALESTLRRPKTAVARERVLDINPRCQVEAHQSFITAANVAQFLAGPWDVVIDAIDGVAPKAALIAAALEAGWPVVSCMGAATRTDPGAVRVADIAKTDICPLARLIRKKLRQQGIRQGVRCVYSIEPPRNKPSPPAAEAMVSSRPGRPRRVLGSLSYMTGIFGLLAAHEALQMIVNLNPAGGGVSRSGASEREKPICLPEVSALESAPKLSSN